MAGVVLEQVRKAFGDVVAVHDVSLDIRDGEFLVLVGPSGCGKSTCLRLVAGLEEMTSGTIRIGEVVVNDIPPQDRDIAMVFQNYALYPHMTVYDNLAFGLRLRREPTGRSFPRTRRTYTEDMIRQRVNFASEQLGIEQLLKRKPRQLSGGQRQRVALGRAIVREPQVFLMDEPLSNLDAKLRVETRAELIMLHQELAGKSKSNTTIYVTHDQTEAMTMGDRIAVMKDGFLMQVDTPLNLYHSPANRFVAEFIGSPQMNVFGPFAVEAVNGTGALVAAGMRIRLLPEQFQKIQDQGAKSVLFGIRPEDLADAATSRVPKAEHNTIPVEIAVREPLGATVHLALKAPGEVHLTAVLSSDSPVWRDDHFEAVVDLEKAHAFDPETEEAIF